MKKIVLYFISSLAAILTMDFFLNGIGLAGLEGVIIFSLFLLGGTLLAQSAAKKAGQEDNIGIFTLINLLILFITIYISDLVSNLVALEDGGALVKNELFFVSTPGRGNLDQIITVFLAALIAVGFNALINWASQDGK